MQQAWAHYPACVFCFSCFCFLFVFLFCFVLFCFFQENVILGSDYPFPLGEHHPGKLIEDAYKDDLELRVRKQSHLVSRCFFFAIDETPPSSSLLKLPLIVIQKFCYHGNVTSHFSSLLTLLSLDYSGTSITFAKTRFGYIEVLFIHYTVTGAENIVRYTEDFVISRFHCTKEKEKQASPLSPSFDFCPNSLILNPLSPA